MYFCQVSSLADYREETWEPQLRKTAITVTKLHFYLNFSVFLRVPFMIPQWI